MARGEVAVEVHGLREFRRDLKRLDPLVNRGLTDTLREAAEKVAVTAGAFAPRASGALAHSIRPFVSGTRISVGSTLPYAGVVHWGGTIRPRGVDIHFRRTEFITRAAEDHADELVDDVGDALIEAAHRVGWRA